MNMTTGTDTSTLRKNSPLFWCTLLVPSAIIAIGINFILNPLGASTAFGIPIHDPTAFPFMWIKGIRDIFSGLVILAFLLRGDRRTTATLYFYCNRSIHPECSVGAEIHASLDTSGRSVPLHCGVRLGLLPWQSGSAAGALVATGERRSHEAAAP